MKQNQPNSHERFQKFYKLVIPILLAFAALTAVGFFLAMRNDFDSVIGHFEHNSSPFLLVIISLIASVLLSLSAMCAARKSASITREIGENAVTTFSAIFASLMSIICLLSSATDLAIGVEYSGLALISAVLTPFIAVSMLLSLCKKFRYSSVRQICSSLAAVAVNLSMFTDYFNFTLPLNSPIRNIVTVMKGAALLYMLSEARISFGLKSGRLSLPFAVFSTGLTASITLGYTCGAILTYFIASPVSNPNPPIFTLALYVAIGLHAAGRLFTLLPAIGKYEEPEKKETKVSATH